jgi:hypothetical protein
VSPETDHGSLPNMKWSFANSHRRLEGGRWSHETTIRDLPIPTEHRSGGAGRTFGRDAAGWPELTNRPSGTQNGTERERHAAFLDASGGVRSGFNPSWFSGASFSATRM